jgi:hypothetical protein
MTTDRLQLTLIPDLRPCVQPPPPEVRAEAVGLIALMLVRLVRGQPVSDLEAEVRDESR